MIPAMRSGSYDENNLSSHHRAALLGMIHTFTEAAVGTAVLCAMHRPPNDPRGRKATSHDIERSLMMHTSHPEGVGADIQGFFEALVAGVAAPECDIDTHDAVTRNVAFAEWATRAGLIGTYQEKLNDIIISGADPNLFVSGVLDLRTFDGGQFRNAVALMAGPADSAEIDSVGSGDREIDPVDIHSHGAPDVADDESSESGSTEIEYPRVAENETDACECFLCTAVDQCASSYDDWVPATPLQQLGASAVQRLRSVGE